MEDIFRKFMNLYFLNGKEYNDPKDDLILLNDKELYKLEIVYVIFFIISIVLIGFLVDMTNYLNLRTILFFSILFFGFLIAFLYVLLFISGNNKVSYFRGLIYIIILFLFIPGYCFYSFSSILPQVLSYYFFYNLFLVTIFFLISKINYFLKNITYHFSIGYLVILMFFKGFFIKLDSHNIKNIVNKMKIPSNILDKDIKDYSNKLKNEFRVYGGILTIYASINFLFGISIYGLYLSFIKPFNEKTLKAIEIFTEGNHGLYILFYLAYGSILISLIVGFVYLLLKTFFLYLEIYFFDLLEEKISKNVENKTLHKKKK